MYQGLLRKVLFDLRGQTLAWGFGMGFLLVLTVALYPSINDFYGDMINQLPEGVRAFMGVGFSLDTFEGYLSAEFFTYSPIALAIFAVLTGTASIVGEENQGTLDVLLSQPISRLQLIFTKMAGLALANWIVIGILLSMFWVTVAVMNIDFKAGRIVAAFLLFWPYLTTVALLSLVLSMLVSSRLFAGTIMAVLLVISYALDSMANLIPWLEPLRPLFLTSYFQGGNALVIEVSWKYIATLTCMLLIGFWLNTWLFIRRDIAIQPSLPFRRLMTTILRASNST